MHSNYQHTQRFIFYGILLVNIIPLAAGIGYPEFLHSYKSERDCLTTCLDTICNDPNIWPALSQPGIGAQIYLASCVNSSHCQIGTQKVDIINAIQVYSSYCSGYVSNAGVRKTASASVPIEVETKTHSAHLKSPTLTSIFLSDKTVSTVTAASITPRPAVLSLCELGDVPPTVKPENYAADMAVRIATGGRVDRLSDFVPVHTWLGILLLTIYPVIWVSIWMKEHGSIPKLLAIVVPHVRVLEASLLNLLTGFGDLFS